MGARIPGFELIGKHTCERCKSQHGPHYAGHRGVLCVACERSSATRQEAWQLAVVVCGAIGVCAAAVVVLFFVR